MVRYDPEFIAAKRKKTKFAVSEKDESELPSDMTWQQLLSRHDSTNYSERLWGMSVFMVQHVDSFTSIGGTCHEHLVPVSFSPQGNPSAS